MRVQKAFRRLHYWGAAIAALPVVVILGTGLLLQLKKNLTWVQPTEFRGAAGAPNVTFEQLLAVAQAVPEAAVQSWDDIPRVEMRPAKGLVKLISTNNTEIQIDITSGAVLHSAYRRSDVIEALHDGSWFFPAAKLWIFLPAGIILFGLWLTGLYLFILPFLARRRQRARLAGNAPHTPTPAR
jgi:uncharacterized iron-regulated membrane protein